MRLKGLQGTQRHRGESRTLRDQQILTTKVQDQRCDGDCARQVFDSYHRHDYSAN